MSSTVQVGTFTYTHSVSFVTDKMLHSLKYIITSIGLNPSNFVSSWHSYESGIKTWLTSRHLEAMILEVSHSGKGLVTRWDFTIDYGYGNGGEEGKMWLDTDAVRYAIVKQGVIPAQCTYKVVLTIKYGAPKVLGWEDTILLSTDGFIKHNLGTTIGTHAIGAQTNYWRKES